MAYVLIDESGNLGFDFSKKGTTHFFIVTLLFTDNLKPVQKIIKKIHRNLLHINKKLTGTLHAVNERPATRKKLLKLLNDSDCKVMAVILNKKKVHTKLQDEKPVLYNFVANILLDRLMNRRFISKDKQVTIIASKRETNRFLNENFKNYLKSQVSKKHKLKIDIVIKTPSGEKALQVVDFASWALFRKHEYHDSSYVKLFSKIIDESFLFK